MLFYNIIFYRITLYLFVITRTLHQSLPAIVPLHEYRRYILQSDGHHSILCVLCFFFQYRFSFSFPHLSIPRTPYFRHFIWFAIGFSLFDFHIVPLFSIMPPLWFINRGWLWPHRICNNACIYIYSIHSHTLYFQLPPLPLCLNVHKPIANETWPAGSHQCERVSIFLLPAANRRNADTRHIWRMWIHVCNWGCLTKVQRFDNDEAAPFGARNSWRRDQRVAWFTVEDEGGVSTLGYHLCTGYVSLFRYLFGVWWYMYCTYFWVSTVQDMLIYLEIQDCLVESWTMGLWKYVQYFHWTGSWR